MRKQKTLWVGGGLAIGIVLFGGLAQPATAQSYSYAVKFVCGFNNSNVGVTSDGKHRGEATVKKGNYATEINIFNPSKEADIRKKVVLLVRDDIPVGREPNYSTIAVEDAIVLPNCTATMDDCNRIAELLYGGPAGVPTPLPLIIGYLVIQSTQDLDVTAVYTTELCSDVVLLGGAAMCTTAPHPVFGGANYDVGLDIDVQRIKGRVLP